MLYLPVYLHPVFFGLPKLFALDLLFSFAFLRHRLNRLRGDFQKRPKK